MSKTARRIDPLSAFRFSVKFDDLEEAGFSECNGLALDTEVTDLAEGGVNTYLHKLVGRTRQSNLVLKRGIAGRDLWNWYWDIVNGRVQFRNAAVRIFSLDGAEVLMEVQLRQAFPMKWTGPDLSASQSNVAIETIEFAHQGVIRRS